MIPLPSIFSEPPFVLEGTARLAPIADSPGAMLGLWGRNSSSDKLD
jgi:hypothetical protein